MKAKIFSSKKAIFDVTRKIFFYMIAGVIITVIILAYAIVLAGYKSNLTEVPPKLQATLIIERFVNNPDCFAYQIDSGTTYLSDSIDLEKFNELQLNHCYLTDSETGYQGLNFEFILSEEGKSIKTNNFFQREDFVIVKPITLWDGTMLRKSTLIIRVQGEV